MRVRAVRVDQLEIPFRVPFEAADMTWRSRRLAILHLVGEIGRASCRERVYDDV